MRTVSRALIVLLLTGCATASVLPPPPRGERVDLPSIDTTFRFPEALTIRSSQGEAMLVGETTAMPVASLPYDDTGDWRLPLEVAALVRELRSCVPFNRADVRLPVDTAEPYRCGMVLDPSGRVVVWMVGLGRPFQDAAFLQSSLLILDETRYHVFSYLFPFPEGDATVQWLADSFATRHPGYSSLLWGNKSFGVHSADVRQALSHQLHPPSEEVSVVLAQLATIALSVRRLEILP